MLAIYLLLTQHNLAMITATSFIKNVTYALFNQESCNFKGMMLLEYDTSLVCYTTTLGVELPY